MITPDTKDWTWVVEKTCPECGFDARAFERERVGDLLRANAAEWSKLLTTGTDLSTWPRPDTWSPLEYACHVRDVCGVYTERLALMLTQHDPHYPNWDQDATAVEQRYNEQDPAAVAEQLGAAARELANEFDQVRGAQWERPGSRSDGAGFTVETFARYFVHDPIHHLYDVTGVRAD